MNDYQNPYAPPTETSHAVPMPARVQSGDLVSPCPNCKTPYATKIKWTLWGGALGPWMFSHVKCCQCGTAFNGKTGESNTMNIAIYMIVSFVIAAFIGLAVVIIPAMAK